MPLRILGHQDVRRFLPMRECIEAVEEAFRALARGEAVNPLRRALRLPGGAGLLGWMPASLGEGKVFGIKALSVFPGNRAAGLESHQGVVLLFEPENGRLLGILDASEITAIRTAAASGVATRLLAREDAGVLALLGSGVQARTHLEAMAAVRPLGEVRIWSRGPDHAEALARAEGARRGIPVFAKASAREAVEAADLVCTVTGSPEPVLQGDWLAPGCHVNAVGACIPAHRELDTRAVERARLFVDSREAAGREAGDYLIPLQEGAVGEDHVQGEIGELLLGRVEGRRDASEITLFKSLGLAVQDLAAGRLVLERAEREGAGIVLDLGGLRHESA
ncbi:MAG: ornithine cyclodeaminase family protein [Planctomycetota bacterium]